MSFNYFIADTHFGHNQISRKFRPKFSSDQEHDETIHDNILSVAGKRNILWILGDTFFNPSVFFRLDFYAKSFMQVNIVLGNHCHKLFPRYALSFSNVQVYGLHKRYGCWLSHAPMHPQELYQSFNVHGHLHNNRVLQADGTIDNRYYCVSCEHIDYRPVDLATIKGHFMQFDVKDQ